MPITIEDIRAAREVIRGPVLNTPTIRSGALSDMLLADVFLKLETLQRTGSFKVRGALVKLDSLAEAQRKKGVIAVSAGNHAQGVALHAQRLGTTATIVMPEGTPFTKVGQTRAFGARVLTHGATVDEAEPYALEMARAQGLTYIHPFDDEKIIAGQGTIALEMLEAVPDLDCLVVPIGGGGLISGIATAAKALRPTIEIIGVEAERYPSMYQALHGLPPSAGGETLAEGIAVKTPGALTLEITRRLVDEIILVDETAIETAVQTLLDSGKIMAEGAGAVPLAAMMTNRERFMGRNVGLVVCGANIDPRILASILMRGMIRASRLIRLRVAIKDAPGALSRIAEHIAQTGGNIVEVNHHRMFYDVSVKQAELDVMVETRDAAHVSEIMSRLKAAGYSPSLVAGSAQHG